MLLVTTFWFYFAPVVIIVPHHNIVADVRLNFLKSIKYKRPFTRHIILIGPDHFSQFQGSIRYSNRDWNLSNGNLKFDQELFSKINFPLTLDNGIIQNDHSIYNILPNIRQLWPNSQIIPIIIGQKFDTNNLNPLIDQIKSVCKFDCLIIASIDFSHYLPATMADAHDSYTLDALLNQNLTKIISSEIDSPQSLYFVSKYAFDKNNKFSLFNHTNSGYLIKNPDIETTTHLFGLFNRFPSFQKSNIKTKLDLPYSIDQSKNLNSLGIRFFYGFDEISINSTLPNFAIITSTSNNKIVQSFFPITNQKNTTNFIKGDEKIKLIKNYFDTITDINITKDYFWGTLFYDRKK